MNLTIWPRIRSTMILLAGKKRNPWDVLSWKSAFIQFLAVDCQQDKEVGLISDRTSHSDEWRKCVIARGSWQYVVSRWQHKQKNFQQGKPLASFARRYLAFWSCAAFSMYSQILTKYINSWFPEECELSWFLQLALLSHPQMEEKHF